MNQYFLIILSFCLFIYFFWSLKKDVIIIYLSFLFTGICFLLLMPNNIQWDHVRFLKINSNYKSVLNILSLNLIFTLATYLFLKKILISKFQYVKINFSNFSIKNFEIDVNNKNIIVIIFFVLYFLIINIEIYKTAFNQIYYCVLILSLFLINTKKINRYVFLSALIYIIIYLLQKVSLCFNYALVEFFLIVAIVFFINKKNFTITKVSLLLIIVIFTFISKDLVKEKLTNFSPCSAQVQNRSLIKEGKFFIYEFDQKKLLIDNIKIQVNDYRTILYNRLYLRFISPYVTLAAVLEDSNKEIIQKYQKYFLMSIFPSVIKNKLAYEYNQNQFGRDIQMINSNDFITALTVNMFAHAIISFGDIAVYFLPVFIATIFFYLNFLHKNAGRLSIYSIILCFFTFNVIGSIEQGSIFDIIKYLIFCFILMILLSHFICLKKS